MSQESRQQIMVFASNLSGVHGAGSAKEARWNHGARLGIGIGKTGNAYAIPTKGVGEKDPDRPGKLKFPILPLKEIEGHVKDFIRFAERHPEMTFNVVAIGCGLAQYTPTQIAPMFRGSPENVNLPEGWRNY